MSLDPRDQEYLEQMQSSMDAMREHIQVGHVVRFADGTMRVVSHVWHDEHDAPDSIQTSDMHGDARLHLGISVRGVAYMEYSGGLYSGIPLSSLMRSNNFTYVDVWIWHHKFAGAGRGVSAKARVPIWECAWMPNRV